MHRLTVAQWGELEAAHRQLGVILRNRERHVTDAQWVMLRTMRDHLAGIVGPPVGGGPLPSPQLLPSPILYP